MCAESGEQDAVGAGPRSRDDSGGDESSGSAADPRRSSLPLLCLACGMLGFLMVPAIVGIIAGVVARRRGEFSPAAGVGLGLSVAWLVVVGAPSAFHMCTIWLFQLFP